MTSPVDRITAVLRLHGDTCTRANAEYLAERVAAELQPMLSRSLMEQLQPEGSAILIQKANSDNLDWTWRVRYQNGSTGKEDSRTGASLVELLSAWSEVQP